jgi:hypothetical protein
MFFDKLSCEDTPAAAVAEAYFEAMAEGCANCGAPVSEGPFCSHLCEDEANGTVDWNANER